MNAAKIITITSLALLLAACSGSKDANKGNFGKAIQSYLDNEGGLCATIPGKELPFTLENNEIFEMRRNGQANALVDAGLLTKRDTEIKELFGQQMQPATEYNITDLGKQYLVGKADAFCTGKYILTEVVNFTEPSEMMGMKMSQVTFRYKVKAAAEWAKSESLHTHYTNFTDQSTGDDIQGIAVLILTNDGWIHERLFEG